MSRAVITRTAVPAASLNLTDATFTTLSTGAGNGVEVPYHAGDVIVLYNSTGGPAVFTIKTAQPTVYSDQSLTVPDKTFSVAAAKMHVLLPASIWRESNGNIFIDCDVAGKVLVLATS